MGDVDWARLYQATNTDNKPTPGYVFNEIVHDVSHTCPKHIPAVANYLADCVDGDHAHVKLKALFVIKTLAYRIPPFCTCMQDRIESVRAASVFTGPPSAVYGDEPYRLVREAAEKALEACTSGEYYHEQYRQMSQRIVGFGNYLPGDDTVLADGSVDVGITYKDVLASAVQSVRGGVGGVFGGVKDLLFSPTTPTTAADDTLALPDRVQEDEVPSDPYGGHGDPCEHEEEDDVDVSAWQPSVGEYIAPPLPAERTPVERLREDMWEEDNAGSARVASAHQIDLLDCDIGVGSWGCEPEDKANVEEVLSEADILRLLEEDTAPVSNANNSLTSGEGPTEDVAPPSEDVEPPSAFSFIRQGAQQSTVVAGTRPTLLAV